MSPLVLSLSLALQPSAEDAPKPEAPVRLFTDSGVEIRLQEEVFQLFAALNAAGYSEESKRRSPPLSAPVYHPLRVDVRDALRDLRDKPATNAVRKLFEANPYPIEDYLAAMIAGPDDRVSANAAKLKGQLGPLEAFAEEAGLQALFDKLAEAQRDLGKKLSKAIEEDLGAVREKLDDDKFRAPTSLVVVPNPLDSHDAYRTFTVGDQAYAVVGPGLEESRSQIAFAAVEPYVRASVDRAWGSASKYRSHWDGVKLAKRISKRYGNGKNYLTVALTRALVHRLNAERTGDAEADELFIDQQAQEGMRWARIVLRVLDKRSDGVPFGQELPRLLAKHGP